MGMIDKITIGVADLYYTAPGSNVEVYLGLTEGGGEFEYETTWHDIDDIDQFGKTVVDSILIGEKANYKTNIVDTSLPAIKRVAPTAHELKDGLGNTIALTFGQRPGLRMQDNVGKLRIHPVSSGFNRSRDIIIYRAGSKAKLQLAFKLDKEWVVPCEWAAYPDEDRQLGDQMFRIGQEEAVLVGPTKRLIDFVITIPSNIMASGANQSITATAKYEDGTSEDVSSKVTWGTTDISVATVSYNGSSARITAQTVNANKTIVVTASYGIYTASTSVTVTA